jgi:hypothetical protein
VISQPKFYDATVEFGGIKTSNLAMFAFMIHTPSHTRVVFCNCKNNVQDAISFIFSTNIFLVLSAFIVNILLYSSSIFFGSRCVFLNPNVLCFESCSLCFNKSH